jgi:isocitrate dehydrogenase
MNGPVTDALPGFVELKMITNRGLKVWPEGLPETFCTDHWRVRYMAKPDKALNNSVIAELLRRLAQAGVDTIKTENLYTFDDEPGYSLGQGQ